MKKQKWMLITTALFASVMFASSASAAEQTDYNVFNVWQQATPPATAIPQTQTQLEGNYGWQFSAPEGTEVKAPDWNAPFDGNYSWVLVPNN